MVRESEEDDMRHRTPHHDQSTAAKIRQMSDPPRKRWPLGLMLYGILTTLGGLALLVVE